MQLETSGSCAGVVLATHSTLHWNFEGKFLRDIHTVDNTDVFSKGSSLKGSLSKLSTKAIFCTSHAASRNLHNLAFIY